VQQKPGASPAFLLPFSIRIMAWRVDIASARQHPPQFVCGLLWPVGVRNNSRPRNTASATSPPLEQSTKSTSRYFSQSESFTDWGKS